MYIYITRRIQFPRCIVEKRLGYTQYTLQIATQSFAVGKKSDRPLSRYG